MNQATYVDDLISSLKKAESDLRTVLLTEKPRIISLTTTMTELLFRIIGTLSNARSEILLTISKNDDPAKGIAVYEKIAEEMGDAYQKYILTAEKLLASEKKMLASKAIAITKLNILGDLICDLKTERKEIAGSLANANVDRVATCTDLYGLSLLVSDTTEIYEKMSERIYKNIMKSCGLIDQAMKINKGIVLFMPLLSILTEMVSQDISEQHLSLLAQYLLFLND